VPDLALPKNFLAAVNNRWLLLGSLLLFALLLNREGDRFPTGNEFVYLLYFWKAWHHGFLASDWTFKETTAGHAIFNVALGWLTLPFSLRTVTWTGRVVSWVATLIGLFRLGRHYKIPPWGVWLGILLWLLQKQSPPNVTGEWMIGSFEAKVVAYPCLLFAIDAALSERTLLAGVLCGIAFSFHSAVGMWGGAALGFMVLTHSPFRKTVLFSLAAIVFSLPGLITSWGLVFGDKAITADGAKYLTTVALTDCFDPYTFSHTWMVVLAILPFFTWLHARWRSGDSRIHQLLIFEIALFVFFAFGIFARAVGRFDWLELYSMRVYAVFALLLFFWQAISVALSCAPSFIGPYRAPRRLLLFGILLFLSMPSPLLCLRDMLATHLVRYLHPYRDIQNRARGYDADFIQCAKWIAQNTPETDVVIAPPWFNEGYYFINRPLIANWHAPRYDKLTEWKARIESMVGDTSHLNPDLAIYGEMDPGAWVHYATLPPEQVARIQHMNDPAAKWLVTTGRYAYPAAFTAGGYTVYQLP
jgi:hypothetical protein